MPSKGRMEEAISCYSRALELDSKLSLVYNNQAAVKLDEGDYEG